MKVGDLVRYKSVHPLDHHIVAKQFDSEGIGVVLQVLTGGIGRKHSSAQIMWSNTNNIQWLAEPNIEVISESAL